jgi:crotonobetainyl-CoA:carnitine CoA-transferase CaiB-like acyl-CoA transferase
MRPFEGIKIIDCTHVLAGPFSCYQLAVLGADVIKVEDANEPDQSRTNGSDQKLVKMLMGASFLAQGANKRSIALNLKTEDGRDAFKRLVRDWADVVVEGYRPGSFKALGLGYEDLAHIKPKLIYVSMSAFGPTGPRGTQTAYDQVIQASSGITASTGTESSGPIKVGAPVIDYAHGAMGAFAISAALYQSLRTGKGQHIDIAMLDVALMLQSSHVTDYLQSGHRPARRGNKGPRAESSVYETRDGLVQLAANNVRQHRRFFAAIDEPEEAARSGLAERKARLEEKTAMIARKMREKTADEWEQYLQSKHVPAGRVRELHEALQDPQLKYRAVLHRFDNVPGIEQPMTVPLAAFKFAHGGPSIERAPARLGEHTDEVLSSIGFSAEEIAALRKSGAAA